MISILSYLPLLAQGIALTASSWILATVISLLIGLLCGMLSCNYLSLTSFTVGIRIFTFIGKGIPAYVQILIAYFVLPSLLGIHIPGFVAATVALGFCSGAYATEIVRAGINALPDGQWEASTILGYSRLTTLARIIMPQALRTIAPALLGESEQLLKSTSLLSSIGVMELTRMGMNIISRELNPLPIYCLIAVLYLLFSALINVVLLFTLKRVSYD